MGRMLTELSARPELGLLRWERGLLRGPMVVQYWRLRADLERFARGDVHVSAWREFNRCVRGSGDVGVWHETYEVHAGAYESAYVNMPVFGLAAAGQSE
jgi:hypothetical protein